MMKKKYPKNRKIYNEAKTQIERDLSVNEKSACSKMWLIIK